MDTTEALTQKSITSPNKARNVRRAMLAASLGAVVFMLGDKLLRNPDAGSHPADNTLVHIAKTPGVER